MIARCMGLHLARGACRPASPVSPSSRSHAFIAKRTLMNLCDQFYFHAGSKRHLSNPESAADVPPYVSKDLSEKLGSPIGHQMLFGNAGVLFTSTISFTMRLIWFRSPTAA